MFLMAVFFLSGKSENCFHTHENKPKSSRRTRLHCQVSIIYCDLVIYMVVFQFNRNAELHSDVI